MLHILQGHTHRVQAVAISPDDQVLASGGNDGTVRLWAAQTGRLHTLTGHSYVVNSVAFHPDGWRLVSGSWDRTIRLWDLDKGEVMGVLQGTLGILAIAFSLMGDFWRPVALCPSETRKGARHSGHGPPLDAALGGIHRHRLPLI